MVTIEYKIRKLAEILEEQGVYLETITLDEARWAEFREDGQYTDETNVQLHVGDNHIDVVQRGVKVDLTKYIPVPGIKPKVTLTPPGPYDPKRGLQRGWSAIEEQQRQAALQRQHLEGWPEGTPQRQERGGAPPLGIEGGIAQDLGIANEEFNAGKFFASQSKVD